MLEYGLFTKLYGESLSYDDIDIYIAERGWQDWMEQFNDDGVSIILKNIFNLAKMSLKEIRRAEKLTRRAFYKIYYIPVRTLENWEYEERKLTDYDKMLICYTVFVKYINSKAIIHCEVKEDCKE